MVQASPDPFVERVQQLAADFPYPPAPDLTLQLASGKIASKHAFTWLKLVRIALVVLILLAGISLLVPPVRAAVLEFLQIGGLRIYLQTPSPDKPTIQPGGVLQGPILSSPVVTPTPPPSLFSTLNLSGKTSLEQASQAWDAPFLRPGPESGLGPPDRVFLQNRDGQKMIFIWLDPADENRLLASLIILKPGSFLSKDLPDSFESVHVRNQSGLWLQGEHFLYLEGNGDSPESEIVRVLGSVLVWEEDGFTYRLESYFDLEQSIAIAESLRQEP